MFQSPTIQSLFEAIKDGHTQDALLLLTEIDLPINEKDEKGYTLLSFVIVLPELQAVSEQLIRKGADIAIPVMDSQDKDSLLVELIKYPRLIQAYLTTQVLSTPANPMLKLEDLHGVSRMLEQADKSLYLSNQIFKFYVKNKESLPGNFLLRSPRTLCYMAIMAIGSNIGSFKDLDQLPSDLVNQLNMYLNINKQKLLVERIEITTIQANTVAINTFSCAYLLKLCSLIIGTFIFIGFLLLVNGLMGKSKTLVDIGTGLLVPIAGLLVPLCYWKLAASRIQNRLNTQNNELARLERDIENPKALSGLVERPLSGYSSALRLFDQAARPDDIESLQFVAPPH